MESVADYRTEIESLHAFFTDWYTAQVDSTAFEQLEQALGPSFEIITPAGTVYDRAEIIDAVRDSYEIHVPGEFGIDIRNVELVAEYADVTVVRYEEWQETTAGTTGRLSTALFDSVEQSSTAQSTPQWRYVHETWLEE